MKTRRTSPATGFTLIELLAATTILLVVMSLTVSLIGSATNMTTSASRRITVREEARSIFDRMALDINSAVQFGQYEIILAGKDGPLSILTKADQGTSRFQRVDYACDPVNNEKRIVRSVRPVGWDESQDITSMSVGTQEVLSQSAAVMRVAVILSDDSVSESLTQPSSRLNPRPVGLIVGLALVDATYRSSRQITSPSINLSGTRFAIDSAREADGWRLFQTTFRFP